MGNISIKLNLRQFKNVIKDMKRKDGTMTKCLVIPIEANHLFEGEKGVYADLTAMQIKNKVGDSKDTHLIKQSFPKDFYNSLTKDQKMQLPIMGNAIVWERQEQEPQQADISIESDDLPF